MASLATLLGENKNLSLTANNRIRCAYSGHEMPARADAVLQYLNSKNFIKRKEWYSYDYSEFAPYIISSTEDDKKLFCTLTKQDLNKIPDEVRKHVNGKKFMRLKAEKEEIERRKAQARENDEECDIWVPSDEEHENDADSDKEDDAAASSSSDEAPKRGGKGGGKRVKSQRNIYCGDEDQHDEPAPSSEKTIGKKRKDLSAEKAPTPDIKERSKAAAVSGINRPKAVKAKEAMVDPVSSSSAKKRRNK